MKALLGLELGLPDINGFEVLQRLREITEIPVVIVSTNKEKVR